MAPGKTTAESDISVARFVDIVPNVSVTQAVDFVADDPSFVGTMAMTWNLTAVDGGTLVGTIADGVPDGISAHDHEVGLSSLANLAAYIQR